MGISDFYHANSIQGVTQRPAFMPLVEFGDANRICTHMQQQGLRRLVLLEDFVGSGSQAESSVHWAIANLNIEVMFVSLIVCPRGAERMRALAGHLPRFSFEPVIEIQASDVFGPRRIGGDALLVAAVEALAPHCHPQVTGAAAHDPAFAPYGPFGYDRTGASVVMFSNVPDNTLPFVHNQSTTWKPLFPRVSRV
jgi:hypothetical protein